MILLLREDMETHLLRIAEKKKQLNFSENDLFSVTSVYLRFPIFRKKKTENFYLLSTATA